MSARIATQQKDTSNLDEQKAGRRVPITQAKKPLRRSSFFATLAVFLFCSAVFVLPFASLPLSGTSLQASKFLLVALLLISSGVSYLYSERGRPITVPRTLFTFLGIFILIISFSTLFSESFKASFVGGFQGASFYVLIVGVIATALGSLIISNSGRVLALFVSLFAGIIVLGLIHTIRLIAGSDILSFGILTTSTSTPVGSWYDLGLLFGVAYMVSLSGVVFGKLPSRLNSSLSVLLFVSLFFLVITHHTTLLVILSILSVLVLLLLLRDKIRKGRALAIVATLILCASVVFSPQINSRIDQMFDIEYLEARPRWESMIEIAQKNLSNPKIALVGNGPNTFAYMWQDERDQSVVESDFWNFDFVFGTSILGTVVLTLGVFAGAFFLVWLWFIVQLTLRIRRDELTDPFSYASLRASLLVALLILIYGFFYVFGIVPLLLLCIFSGVSAGAVARQHEARMSVVRFDAETGSYAYGASMVILSVIALHLFALILSSVLYSQVVVRAQSISEVADFDAMYSKLAISRFLDWNDKLERTKSEISLLEMQFLSTFEEAEVTEEIQNRFVRAIERAEEAGRSAVAIDPRNYVNWITGGYVFEALGELGVEKGHDTATLFYAQARAEHPTHPEILLIQARLEHTRGNHVAARAFIQESIEMKKSYVSAYLLLAQMELSRDNEAQALVALEQGIRANPRNNVLHYEAGVLHYRLNNFDRAVEAFTRAIENDPNYANALYFRGLSHHTLGDKTSSLRDLEKVLAMNKSNEDLKRVVSNIRENREPFLGVDQGGGSALPRVGDEATLLNNTASSEYTPEEGAKAPGQDLRAGEGIEGNTSGIDDTDPGVTPSEEVGVGQTNPLTGEAE